MAALTTETTLFGAKGVSCPATMMKMVDITRVVDFKVNNTAANKNYDIIAIPRGFLALAVAVEQLEKVATSATITFGSKSADTKAMGGSYALSTSADSLLRACYPAVNDASYVSSVQGSYTAKSVTLAAPIFFAAGDTLCLKGPAAAVSTGKIRVHLIGYQVFGDGINDVAAGTPAYATGQTNAQAADNVSGGDPMFH